MALNDYLAEEITLDHADGHISRREALQLLMLLGVAAPLASGLLDARSADAASKNTVPKKKPAAKAKPASTTTVRPKTATTSSTNSTSAAPTTLAQTATTGPVASAGNSPAVSPLAISFAGPAGQLFGSFAGADKPKGAVLIIHENRGLTDHFMALPGRFAADGYSALAIDLASRVGGTAAVASQMPAPLANARGEDLVADMKAGLDELAKRTPGVKLAVTGFCFGGGMVWSLLNAGDPRLAAGVPFYGTGPGDADFTRSQNAAVMAVYAELDSRVNANRPAMTAALEKAKLVHQIVTVPGVDHAFFNDTGARYNASQASATYAKVLDWFAKHLA
jgi:carboxymethylenebutenolidase